MPITKLEIADFLQLPPNVPVLDVRSPGEYNHAHIPGAHAFPLFTDEERKIVGTAYKQESREKAIKIGLEYFGKKMVSMVEVAERLVSGNTDTPREVAVHCWRGGMRSSAVAWLLDLYGFKVYVLTGGYKNYRRWVLKEFENDYNLCILGGYTGSNKTGILKELAKTKPVIDLEALAAHKGSAFGNLDFVTQPSQEHFENLLMAGLHRFKNAGEPIWLEAESQRLGLVNIPFKFFNNMRRSPMVQLVIPFEERLSFIMHDYGKYSKEKLLNATLRIKKRLGGLETKNAVNCLLEEDVKGCFTILLKYYDKLYQKSTVNNEYKERLITQVDSDTTDPIINSKKIVAYAG
jgi:tRNA 2-selenouridine synthase